MTTLALLLVFPLAWPFVAKALWKHEITLGEMALNLLIGVAVVSGGWALGRYAQAADTEIINGQLTSKSGDRVSCDHSYRCNCRQTCTGTGKDRSCSETCDTCYEHSYDVDWNLHTTVGDVTIDRVDRQGLSEPPRFSRALVGDPIAKTHSFQNYIKAAPDSLFNALQDKQVLEQYKSVVPAYPDGIYDYHYVNRVLSVGVPVPDLAAWNRDLAMRLRTLGPSKQANVVIVFTREKDAQFANGLRAAWLGGKKNDVVVVLGTPSYPTIDWVRVISWTDKEVFKVQLRDALLDLKTIDQKTVLDTIEQRVAKDFVRKHMADFAYLKNQIEPPGWAIALLVVLSIVASVGSSLYLARNNVTSNGLRGGLRRYRF